jgi:radical SAM protein with 4Fe4S-binding SPASM domain
MDIRLYEKLLDEVSATTAMLSLYFQGEPLMNKDFPAFVRLATEKGIYTQTSTSGQFLTEGMCRGIVEGGLDRIIISLDGTDQDSYQAYRRGGELKKVEEGIRTLVRQRKEAGTMKPYLVVQFLVFKHNQRQIPEVKEIAGSWGADRVWIKPAQMEYRESADEWIPEAPEYSRYERDDRANWKLKGKLRNRCKRLWQTTVITSDGLSVPCCFDKRAEFPMGNMENESLELIWKNESYREFRKQVLGNRTGTGICLNCTEGIGRIKPS